MMATKRKKGTRAKGKKLAKESINQYTHGEAKRPNNPPVGLVTPSTDPDTPSKKYQYDPRLDPQLQWSGKQENSEFDVDTASLHVHERIDPLTILERAMKPQQQTQQTMFNYFEAPENNPPLRDAIDFYKHDQGWSNRLIAGDSLLVMNSLLEKEGMEGKVQMIYMDPPYGIKYGSNFQPFVNKRDVKDGNDIDLTQEPETIKAFRDTWELGIHSYLTYLQNRLLLMKKLLNETGSIFIQISDENVHLVRNIMDQIFGNKNFISSIHFQKVYFRGSNYLDNVSDTILWYAKNYDKLKFRKLFRKLNNEDLFKKYKYIEENKKLKTLKTIDQFDPEKCFLHDNLLSPGSAKQIVSFKFNGINFKPSPNYHWKIGIKGLEELKKKNRLIQIGNWLKYKRFASDFPFGTHNNIWTDTVASTFGEKKSYVVQTYSKVIERCILLSTDPSDLVFDATCGSGTTAFVAEQWGRRWITCDTSRIATVIAKQRLMTGIFNYYNLAHLHEGLKSGFKYKTIPHVTLGSIANNETTLSEILYNDPEIDKSKTRVSGPFTVEAVPSPVVKSIDILSEESYDKLALHKEIPVQQEWRDELQKTGIRGKRKQNIEFIRIKTHPATRWLHADAEIKEGSKRAMISFGPEHAPLEQRQVALAMEEAQTLIPKPDMVIFAAMQFDPEAAKDIDELNWPGVTILKVEMNKDLLTSDLKKKRSSNESFWLMGQPDVELQNAKGKKYMIAVNGFDYYNTRTGQVESGGSKNIAMWMLDTDYDGRSVYPSQVFFPMGGETGGWHKLAKTLQAQIDEDLITKYQGTESIPFEAGPNKRAAVKIIDDRGIESLKIIQLE